MQILVIPDCHLKPWMFEEAASIMRSKKTDNAVCLMDIPDDFGKDDPDLYEKTYDAAIAFAKEFPDTLWCYGNHDLSYKLVAKTHRFACGMKATYFLLGFYIE